MAESGLRITHTTYIVPDVEQAVDFLIDVLGFGIIQDEVAVTGDRFLTVGPAGESEFAIQVVAAPDKARFAPAAFPGVVSFILQADDINDCMRRVSGAGLAIPREPLQTPYGVTAIFEDPFGYLWDVVERPA